MINWREGLNEDQLLAAENLIGPQLILAGAGSGKTKTMTSRICHMIQEGINASNILAITFTKKAATEMRERLMKILNVTEEDLKNKASFPTMCTFHSLGYLILRSYGKAVGYRNNCSILDEKDREKRLRKIVADTLYKTELELAETDAQVKSIKEDIKEKTNIFDVWISSCKDGLLTPNDKQEIYNRYEVVSSEHLLEQFLLVYGRYEEDLLKDNLADYDDLIEKAVFCLKIPQIKESINRIYRYISVDEYQDTSAAQLEMVKLLAGEDQNVCVVGDDYQSIYAFRGAVIENILNFPNHFPSCKTVILHANYRSTEHIVNGAAHMIKHNKNQFEKELFAFRGAGDRININSFPDGRSEAYDTVKRIKEYIDNGDKCSDIAVLYRTRPLSRGIEEYLLKARIPYVIYGDVGFYDRLEIRDAIAYLKLVAGYDDTDALDRVLNVPKRGIGKKTQEEFMRGVYERSTTSLLGYLSSQQIQNSNIRDFISLLINLKELVKNRPLKEALEIVLEKSGIFKFYKDALNIAMKTQNEEKIDDATARLDHLRELISKAEEFESSYIPSEEGRSILDAFLEEISLYTDSTDNNKKEEDCVKLMTIHKSKGLEFKRVFMIGQECDLSGGIYDNPDKDPNLSFDPVANLQEDIEEERRVFYVGMTRAKDTLYISYADSRYIFGKIKARAILPFIAEIPKEDIQTTSPINVA